MPLDFEAKEHGVGLSGTSSAPQSSARGTRKAPKGETKDASSLGWGNFGVKNGKLQRDFGTRGRRLQDESDSSAPDYNSSVKGGEDSGSDKEVRQTRGGTSSNSVEPGTPWDVLETAESGRGQSWRASHRGQGPWSARRRDRNSKGGSSSPREDGDKGARGWRRRAREGNGRGREITGEYGLTMQELWATQEKMQGEVQAAKSGLRGEDLLYGVAPLLAALRVGKRDIHQVFIQVRTELVPLLNCAAPQHVGEENT